MFGEGICVVIVTRILNRIPTLLLLYSWNLLAWHGMAGGYIGLALHSRDDMKRDEAR